MTAGNIGGDWLGQVPTCKTIAVGQVTFSSVDDIVFGGEKQAVVDPALSSGNRGC